MDRGTRVSPSYNTSSRSCFPEISENGPFRTAHHFHLGESTVSGEEAIIIPNGQKGGKKKRASSDFTCVGNERVIFFFTVNFFTTPLSTVFVTRARPLKIEI